MKTYALPVSILFLSAALLLSVFMWNSKQASGSVFVSNEYAHTELTSADAGATSTLRTAGGSIAQIVVEDPSSAVEIGFYATTSQATSSDDRIIGFDAAASEGTYTYDLRFANGLLMDVPPAFDGDIVVMYR